MTATLSLTAAGRAAAADAANVGIKAIRLRRLAVGSGQRPANADDDAIAALRNSRDVQDVAGNASTPGHVAFRADIDPSADYSVTEVGLWASIGAAGPLFLFGYWAAGSAADAVAAAARGTTLVLAGVIAITSSDADIDVTPAVTVQVGGVTPPDASTAVKGLAEFATVEEHRTGDSEALAATPAGVSALISDLRGSATKEENTLGKLGDLIGVLDAALSAAKDRITATEAFGARITDLEGRPVGNETLLYGSAAGLAVNTVSYKAVALGDDLADYDAFHLLFGWSNPEHLARTSSASVLGVGSRSADRVWLMNAANGTQAFDAYLSARRTLQVKGKDPARLYAVVGITYDRP